MLVSSETGFFSQRGRGEVTTHLGRESTLRERDGAIERERERDEQNVDSPTRGNCDDGDEGHDNGEGDDDECHTRLNVGVGWLRAISQLRQSRRRRRN